MPATSTLRSDDYGQDPNPEYSLIVVGPKSYASIRLPQEGSIVVGRDADCEVRVWSRRVSRRHAKVEAVDGAYTVTDLGSVNGTHLRSGAIAPNEPVTLSVDDPFRIGRLSFSLQRRLGYGEAAALVREHFLARLDELMAQLRGDEAVPTLYRIAAPSVPALDPEDAAETISVALGVDRGFVGALRRNVWVAVAVPNPDVPDDTDDRSALTAAFARHGTSVEIIEAALSSDTSPAAIMARLMGIPPEVRVRRSEHVVEQLASPQMQRIYQQLDAALATDLNVVISGDTGTGKGILAQEVHQRSSRRDRPFVRINCAAPPELVDEELFGRDDDPGGLQAADGGMLLLDEVAHLSLELQGKLLHVLDTCEVSNGQACSHRALDLRFVATTNEDLKEATAQGRFRSDLYYRLAGLGIHVPPLRERPEDIRQLAAAFVRAARGGSELGPSARALLESHAWPGNVRELRCTIELAVAATEASVLQAADITLDDGDDDGRTADAVFQQLTPQEREARERIVEALQQAAGNQTRAAQALGISRRTLLSKLDEFRIPRPRKRRA